MPGTWSKPLNMGKSAMGAIKTDGTLWSWGNNEYGELAQNNLTGRSSPIQIGSETNWSSDGIDVFFGGTDSGGFLQRTS